MTTPHTEINSEITITPDPQILQVLTYLEMRPIDSLCELIDNSVDAFTTSTEPALVVIDLPTTEVRRELQALGFEITDRE